MFRTRRVFGWLFLLTMIWGVTFAVDAQGQPTRAAWDLQLAIPAYLANNVGAEFDGFYFYTCRSTYGAVTVYDNSGSFQWIAGTGGVPGLWDLAFDGRFLYGGNAENLIYQMDVIWEELAGTITSPVPVRHIAYDNDNDAFWVGDAGGDIVLVDRTGATLATIPQASHGLSGIHGSAYDSWSPGGPYLWLFDQGTGPGSPQYIHQISLTTMAPTGLAHDAAADLAVGNDLAGGLFLTPSFSAGTVTLGGLMQGDSETLFCYELTDWVPPENYLSADFDDKAIDEPIGDGGPAVGEPVNTYSNDIAWVRDGPMPTPSLELLDTSTEASNYITFEFHEGFEVTAGMVEITADLWFFELGPGHDFSLGVRETRGAAHTFLSLDFRNEGEIFCFDANSWNGTIGYYEIGRITPLRLRFDMAAGTYWVWVDEVLLIANESHGIFERGIGSINFGNDYDTDLVGRFNIDNLLVRHFDPTGVDDDGTPGLPVPMDLQVTAYPNPFNPGTTIRYSLPVAGPVDLRIFDLQGHLIRTLEAGYRTADTHSITWDGADEAGQTVAAGSYLYRLQAVGGEKSGKLSVIK